MAALVHESAVPVLLEVLRQTKPPRNAWTQNATDAARKCATLCQAGLLESCGTSATGTYWRVSGRGHELLQQKGFEDA